MAWNKLSNYKTTIACKDGSTVITYQSTPIVEFDNERIILRTGGWKSVTTKRKMNQASSQFDLGYGVRQENYAWFVSTDNWKTEIPFEGDNMVLKRQVSV